MTTHPGDYDLVCYMGQMVRDHRPSLYPRIRRLRMSRRAPWADDVYDRDGRLVPRWWSFPRITDILAVAPR